MAVYLGNKADRMIAFMEITVALLMLMDALAWTFRGYPGELGAVMMEVSS